MESSESPNSNRALVARACTAIEDVDYVGHGLLLAGSALVLLVSGVISFGHNLFAGSLTGNIVALLDRLFQHFIIELAVLTILIVALVVSLILLNQKGGKVVAESAT